MGRLFRFLFRLSVTLTVAALLLGLFGVLWLRKSVQPMTGEMAIAGLTAEATIVRDKDAIPHIIGATDADVYAAMGFAHAQDRLWQMEMSRRSIQGRLSEMFGERTLKTDIFLRTLNLHGLASQSVAYLAPEMRGALEAYARGVNAFINRETSLLEPQFSPEFFLMPPKFVLARHQPEPWTPADSISIIKLMQFQLSKNLSNESRRLKLAQRGFSPSEIDDLEPITLGEEASPLPELASLYPLNPDQPAQEAQTTSNEFPFAAGAWASNNWVVSGKRSVTGKPLLANDPHLGLSAPAIWYLAHLTLPNDQGPASNVIGASLPGAPVIVIGRNDNVAWGMTNTGGDVQDIFIERIDPADPSRYLTPQGSQPFQTETITIKVRGQDDHILERRQTRHGPILPPDSSFVDGVLAEGHVAALSWSSLTPRDRTIEAIFRAARATNVDEFMGAIENVVGPMQSTVVADTEGAIGFIAAARVPVRNPDNDIRGRAPVPGWDEKYDWTGWIRDRDLPRAVNPASGAIATANTRIVGPEYEHFLTHDWAKPHRAARIVELLNGRAVHSLESFQSIQLDTHAAPLRKTITMMLKQIGDRPGRPAVSAAVLDWLETWDGTMERSDSAPLVAVAWVNAAAEAILKDDLGQDFEKFRTSKSDRLASILSGQANARNWCDNRLSEPVESCKAVLEDALDAAIADLTEKYGKNPDFWQWGEAHIARGRHATFGKLPVINSFFNVEVPSSGGAQTLNRGDMSPGDPNDPFGNIHAASYRAIYDLSMPDRSVFIHSTGQSGNPFSPHYRDFAERWSAGDYIIMTTKPAEYGAGALGTFRLYPPGTGATQQ